MNIFVSEFLEVCDKLVTRKMEKNQTYLFEGVFKVIVVAYDFKDGAECSFT